MLEFIVFLWCGLHSCGHLFALCAAKTDIKHLQWIICWSGSSHSIGVSQRGLSLMPYLTCIARLRQGWGLNWVSDWTTSGARDQWRWIWVIYGCALSGVVLGGFISVIGAPHGYHTLAVFVGLGWAEARFIKLELLLRSSKLIRSEERKKYYENNGQYTGEHGTYKRNLKRKLLGVRYVQTSTVSLKKIPSGEITIWRKKSWETGRPPTWGINGPTKSKPITIS